MMMTFIAIAIDDLFSVLNEFVISRERGGAAACRTAGLRGLRGRCRGATETIRRQCHQQPPQQRDQSSEIVATSTTKSKCKCRYLCACAHV
jgi:hypothetical protein